MIFKLTTGSNPDGEVIKADRRGTILPSTQEASKLRSQLASLSPRLGGKKVKKEIDK